MSPLDALIRSSAIIVAGLLLRGLLRRRSAAQRHAVLAASVIASAAVVPLVSVAPPVRVPLPVAVAADPASPAAPGGKPVLQALTTATPANEKAWSPSLNALWGGGATLMGVMLAGALLRIRTIARRARPAGMREGIPMLQTDVPGVLATIGALRPRILLPSHAPDWPSSRLDVVLAHELAHIKRHDWAVQMAAEVVRVVLWFNPLVWLACTLVRRDAERACDDLVLARGIRPDVYATELVALARLCRPAPAVRLSAVAMANPSTLERRITAMLNPALDRRPLSRWTIAAASLLSFALVIPIAGVRAAQTGPATLGGAIYDATGAVLPGVHVELEGANDAKWTAASNAQGRFEFPAIDPGKYTLAVSLAGFKTLKQQFELRDSRDWDRAITLQVGDLRETVTVRDTRLAAPAAAQPQFASPIRVGGNIRAPRKTHDVRPIYPVSMRTAGREGVVPIEAIVGIDGTVSSVRVVSADVHPDFAIAAVDAVRQWQFTPTLLNGKPVEVVISVSVSFTLGD